MGYCKKVLIASSILSLLVLPVITPAAAAGSTFDGTWNVHIASSNSACNAGTSVSIGISNGQVASNSAAVTASGRVADAGNNRVLRYAASDVAKGGFATTISANLEIGQLDFISRQPNLPATQAGVLTLNQLATPAAIAAPVGRNRKERKRSSGDLLRIAPNLRSVFTEDQLPGP